MKLLGFEKVTDAKTLSYWLRHIGDSRQSMQALVEISKCILSAGLHHCKRVMLDIDATVIECSGRETKFNCKGSRVHAPVTGHPAEFEQVADADFREGNAPPYKSSNQHRFRQRGRYSRSC